MTCLLCDSADVVELERIRTHDLAQLYWRRMHIDIGALVDGIDLITYVKCRKCDLRFFDPPMTGDETFYNALQGFSWYSRDEKPEYDDARDYVHASDAVLEVGCGKGAFAAYIPADDYLGLELSDEAKRLAGERGVAVENEFVETHAEAKPERYDVVCGFQVLEHVNAVRSFLEGCLACLKPGGRLIMAVPSLDSFLAYATNNHLNLPPHHVTHWTDRALESIGRQYDLDVVAIRHERVAEFHMVWFAKIFGMNVLRSWLGRQPRLVDRRLSHRLMGKLGSVAGGVLRKGLSPALLPNGHTVLAVYQKR